MSLHRVTIQNSMVPRQHRIDVLENPQRYRTSRSRLSLLFSSVCHRKFQVFLPCQPSAVEPPSLPTSTSLGSLSRSLSPREFDPLSLSFLVFLPSSLIFPYRGSLSLFTTLGSGFALANSRAGASISLRWLPLASSLLLLSTI